MSVISLRFGLRNTSKRERERESYLRGLMLGSQHQWVGGGRDGVTVDVVRLLVDGGHRSEPLGRVARESLKFGKRSVSITLNECYKGT